MLMFNVLGAFVAALEYSASTEAKIIGKPSKTFFEQAIADVDGVTLQDCIMIGDVCSTLSLSLSLSHSLPLSPSLPLSLIGWCSVYLYLPLDVSLK